MDDQILEKALDSLYLVCYGDSKSFIDPRDRDKAKSIIFLLQKNGHPLDENKIRKYLRVKKRAKAGFVKDFLKYVEQAKKGTMRLKNNILAPDLYEKWKSMVNE